VQILERQRLQQLVNCFTSFFVLYLYTAVAIRSLAIAMERLKSLRVIDARIGRESQVVDIVSEGPSSVTYHQVVTPDPTSLAPTFTIQPSSVRTGVNRNMRLRVRGTLNIVGANLQLLGAATSSIALRQFALQSIMQSLQCQINDFTTSLGSIQLYTSALAAVSYTSKSMAGVGSTFACIPDTHANYDMDLGAAGIFSQAGGGPYSDDATNGRTAQITGLVIDPAGFFITLNFDVSESLLVSPFNYTNSDSKYLYGIQTMTVSLSYANAHRMISWASQAGAATVTSVALVPNLQQLECEFVTPDDMSLIERPFKHVYDWTQVQYFSTVLSGAQAPGASFTITSNSIELPVIPSKFVVMATYSTTDLQNASLSLADVSFPVQNCSVQFGTRAGLLSGATQVNLYEVSRRGGSHCKFPIWAGRSAITSIVTNPASIIYAGSPLLIDVAADLSLPAGAQPVTPGMNQRVQFAFTGTFVNQTNAVVNNPRLIILALTPGYIQIEDGATLGQLGGVTLETARTAPIASLNMAATLQAARQSTGFSGGGVNDVMSGAGFFGDLWSGIKSIAPMAASFIPGVGPIAGPLLGKLLGQGPAGGSSIGGARSRLQLGNGPAGGRLMGAAHY
jgi:hypothetical protein